jgi:hypothetical protein
MNQKEKWQPQPGLMVDVQFCEHDFMKVSIKGKVLHVRN